MSSNENNFMHEFLRELTDVLEKAAKLYTDAQRARALDVLKPDALKLDVLKPDALKWETIVPLFEKLAKTPVWDMLRIVIQDAAAQMLEEESFSPLDAAKPARHVLQALETIRRAGDELQRWKTDVRFNPPNPNKSTAPPFKWPFNRKPPQQRVNVPVGEIVEQLAYLTGLLTIAGQEAHLASQTIMRVRDPRLHIAADHIRPQLPEVESPEFFLPLPTSWRQSKGDKGRDLLDYLVNFGEHLTRTADRGRERIRNASVDDKAFSPSVVGAQAITISNIVKNGLSTCNALVILAMQYVGDTVTIEQDR